MVESPASDVSLKDLSPAEFSRLSALLDESIEMAPGKRDAWLAALESREPTTGGGAARDVRPSERGPGAALSRNA